MDIICNKRRLVELEVIENVYKYKCWRLNQGLQKKLKCSLLPQKLDDLRYF